MAKQIGPLIISGSLGNLTFYTTDDGSFVKKKSSLSAQRIKSDPSFERSLENNHEFGSASHEASLFSRTFFSAIREFKDGKSWRRTVELIIQLRDSDHFSVRGKRSAGQALLYPEGQSILQGFEFHKTNFLSNVLLRPVFTDLSSGSVALTCFVPTRDFAVPAGATHIALTSYFTVLDFGSGSGTLYSSPTEVFTIDNTERSVVLKPDSFAGGKGVAISALKVVFLREIGEVLCPVKSGGYAMRIVGAGPFHESTQ